MSPTVLWRIPVSCSHGHVAEETKTIGYITYKLWDSNEPRVFCAHCEVSGPYNPAVPLPWRPRFDTYIDWVEDENGEKHKETHRVYLRSSKDKLLRASQPEDHE